MTVKVVIPWRPEPTREPPFDWVCAYYRHRLGDDCVHVEVDESDGPFNRAKIINRGVARFPDAKIVISDADCFICDHSLFRAIREVDRKLLIPHGRRYYMTKGQARQILARDPARAIGGQMFRQHRAKAAIGGIWVIRADVFLKKPMDERFEGWGFEDVEFYRRVPRVRYKRSPLYHIWHEPASRAYRERNRALFENIRENSCA